MMASQNRITYFIYSTFRPNNAADNRALAYLRSLSKLGYRVTVLFMLPDNRYSKIEDDIPGITVEYCWEKWRKKGLSIFSYIKCLLHIYKRVKPGDIVYLYGSIDCLMLLSRKKKVHIFHERTEHPHTHPARGIIARPSLRRYLTVCKKIDGLFVISTTLREFFISAGVPESRITIINSFVDFARFTGLSRQKVEPYFAYCGNGNNKKDKVDELIKVFSRVAKRHNEIKLYLIGPSQQVYQDEKDNVQLVHELGLDNSVVFTGVKPASEVPQLLVNSLALFLTRPNTLQNRSGFSTKLGEYLASGNPVVVAAVGDIPLYLHDHINAFVYPPEDYYALEKAMEFILSHPKESSIIAAAGKETAVIHFNALNETIKMVKAFESVTI